MESEEKVRHKVKRKLKIDNKRLTNSFKYASEGIKQSYKGEQNLKIHTFVAILVIVFGITAYSNNIIINKYLEKETIEEYKGEKYITYKLNNETYYYKIYSDYLRSKQALFSVSRKEIKEEGYTYVIDTITVFDDKGQIVEVKTEGDTKVVS